MRREWIRSATLLRTHRSKPRIVYRCTVILVVVTVPLTMIVTVIVPTNIAAGMDVTVVGVIIVLG